MRIRGTATVLAAGAVSVFGTASPAAAVPSGASSHVSSLPLLHAVPDLRGSGRIVDAAGRQVVLRGVAVNSLGQYGRATSIPPTAPFHAQDATVIHRMGWNVVRVIINWSRVEPSPGRYDDAYLRRVAALVHELGRVGVYSIVDMHQDAWSRSLATRPGEICPPPTTATLGFDGAPTWATLGESLPHCQVKQQEGSPAVYASWQAFLSNAPGPGGVGVQTRFLAMWRHVADWFARSTDVAGFDVLNEPMLLGPSDWARAAQLYARTVTAIRAGEQSGHGVRHIVMVEPSILFSESGEDTPVPFRHDSDVAFAPHIYTGTFPTTGPPDDRWFRSAHQFATLLGGVPVVNGEWGGRPRSRNPIDAGFYRAYQALQDRHQFSGIFWVYRSSCGDPFEITQHATQTGGLYDIHCPSNQYVGIRHDLMHLLARPYPQAVMGRLTSFSFDPTHRQFQLTYQADKTGHADSRIAVPRRRFPHGYRVEVHGAAVVSTAGARVLQIRNCPGATVVRVTVTPGRGTRDQHCLAVVRRNGDGSAEPSHLGSASTATSGELATTGSSDATLGVAGLLLALAGAGLRRVMRRRG